MRTLIVDRIEGGYAVCEEQAADAKSKKPKELQYFGILIDELPEGAGEGSVLVIGEDGVLRLDANATKARREAVLRKQKKLWADE